MGAVFMGSEETGRCASLSCAEEKRADVRFLSNCFYYFYILCAVCGGEWGVRCR